jgi:hypothetical protein
VVIWLALYLAGVLAAWWIFTPPMVDSLAYSDPTVGDRVSGSFFALGIGALWPIALPVFLMAMSRTTPKVREAELREREFVVREAERRIARLERELGVDR